MNQATKARVLKFLRTIHAWTGIFIFPWIILIALTGFYLNHSKGILALIMPPAYDESGFADWPGAKQADQTSALALAATVWPEESAEGVVQKDYHKRPSFIVEKPSGKVIVNQATGHYFVKTSFTNKTYAPDGTLLDSKIYWGSLFKTLHTRGWAGQRFGTWISDIISLALITFSASGIFLWYFPRSRKISRLLRRE